MDPPLAFPSVPHGWHLPNSCFSSSTSPLSCNLLASFLVCLSELCVCVCVRTPLSFLCACVFTCLCVSVCSCVLVHFTCDLLVFDVFVCFVFATLFFASLFFASLSLPAAQIIHIGKRTPVTSMEGLCAVAAALKH